VAALLVIAFLGGWFSHQYFGDTFNQSNTSKAYAQLIQQAWVTIDQNYVDRKAVNYKQMAYNAITAMAASLNDHDHTRFLTPEGVQSENEQLSATYVGIGIQLRQDKKTKQFVVTSTIPGTPAAKSGVRYGDILVAVNGTDIAGKDARTLLQGKVGTPVTLTVRRPATQQTITFHMALAEIKEPSVFMHYIAEDRIADIQIMQFSDGAADQLKESLQKAKSMGAKRIILDLRDNPGGYLTEAEGTASEFLPSGNVLLQQDSAGRRTAVPVSGNTVDTTDPIVVLVNHYTASAAEIVSGALQDNQRAIIMGETTFGTGTVLQQFPLADGSALLLGIQEWLTPNGHFIRATGITPDSTVKLDPNTVLLTASDANSGSLSEQQILSSGDAQLAAAIKYLRAVP
jgi:carboxyl-terminal processing protease